MDMSFMTGQVNEEHLRKARPEWIERLQAEDQLESRRATTPARSRLALARLSGYIILGAGLILLASVMLAFLGK
jgi:hypothetical protein